jgi:hypothetical protein
MIEATENNFEDRPNIYEIEQIIWENGKGQTYTLLIEAFSIEEAIKLSCRNDENPCQGKHEVISAKQIGSVCLRSKDFYDKMFPKNKKDEIKILKILDETEYISSGLVNQTPDMCRARVIADIDMQISTIKEIKKHIDNS